MYARVRTWQVAKNQANPLESALTLFGAPDGPESYAPHMGPNMGLNPDPAWGLKVSLHGVNLYPALGPWALWARAKMQGPD